MTHPIGTGTVNLTLNIPVDERAALGRAALAHGARSVGDYVRRLVLLGLSKDDAQAARQVREVRRRYYGTLAAALVAWIALSSSGEQMRRPPRPVRANRQEEVAS